MAEVRGIPSSSLSRPRSLSFVVPSCNCIVIDRQSLPAALCPSVHFGQRVYGCLYLRLYCPPVVSGLSKVLCLSPSLDAARRKDAREHETPLCFCLVSPVLSFLRSARVCRPGQTQSTHALISADKACFGKRHHSSHGKPASRALSAPCRGL